MGKICMDALRITRLTVEIEPNLYADGGRSIRLSVEVCPKDGPPQTLSSVNYIPPLQLVGDFQTWFDHYFEAARRSVMDQIERRTQDGHGTDQEQ